MSFSYTHSFSHTLSLSGTFHLGPNRHRLLASLVQEDYADRRQPQFTVKLLKTFGKSN